MPLLCFHSAALSWEIAQPVFSSVDMNQTVLRQRQRQNYTFAINSAKCKRIPCATALPRKSIRAIRRCLSKLQGRDADTTKGIPAQQSNAAPQEGMAAKSSQLLAVLAASPLFYVVAGAAGVFIISSLEDNSYSVFVLAALPIVFLTLLSKSSVGQQVQDALALKLPELERDAAALRASYVEARQRSSWYGPQRPRLLGSSAPHLQGEVAGDYGFDPLGLAADPSRFSRLYEAELVHGRWAMLAALGCLVPEALSLGGTEVGEPVWWKVGAAKLNGDITLNYAGIEGLRLAGKQGIWLIAACQAVLMGGPEYARYVGIKSLEPVGVFLPGDQNYPGGTPFDPFNLAKEPDYFVDQAVREVKHGRLAMLAMLGYFAQAAVTRRGPLDNLLEFLVDPGHNNITQYLS